jgi:type I restriction enzyme, S subunit
MRKTKQLPEGWKRTALDSICDLQAGKFVPASEILETCNGSFYPCYGGNGLRGFVKDYSHNGTFPLIGRQGALCGNINKASGKFYATEHAVVATPNTNIEVEWLYYQLIHANLNKYATGAAQPGLSVKNIKEVPFVVPPLPEQKAIADLLSTWDEAIEKTERLIQAKEKRFKWLLRELISKPRNTQKDAKWKKVKIGSFLTESRISGTNGRDAHKITVKLYGKGVIAKDEKRIGSETTQYYVRKSGQFIYSKLDFLNGAFGIIPEELDGFESTLDLPAFDISDSVSKEWFLYYLIRPEYYTRQLGLAKGQRKARRVNPSEFLNSKIPFPPLEIQNQIAETLSAAQYEIDLLKQLADKYKTQKRGLMQKMLTGEWRVKPEIVNQ